jgi:PAS domain S-box-containing protein
MNVDTLKQRVQARDRLIAAAENAGSELHRAALQALARGDIAAAEAAVLRHDGQMQTLVENLSVYQAELHAQAAELEAGHERAAQLLTRFSALFEKMPVATLLVDASGVLVEANARASALFALQQPRLAPRFMHRLVEPGHYQRLVRPAFLRAGVDGHSALDAVDFVAEDGRSFVGELHIAALPAGAGQPAQYATAVIDRTEQIRASQASAASLRRIEELSEHLSLAVDAGGIGAWRWNPELGEFSADARMQRLLGAAAPVGAGAPAADAAADVVDALAPGEWLRLRAALERALRDGALLDIGVQLAGAPPRHLHLIGRGHDGGDGRPRGVLGCAHDCTAEVEARRGEIAREAAEFASRAKSAFLSRMSHELRTPLNAILGFAQLMRMEADAGDLTVKPHRAQLIETAARHLLELINEVMDVTRIEAGRMELRPTRFEVAPMVAECLPMVVGMADAAAIRLQADADPALWVVADRLRLKEVLINLLSNAVKYNRAGGEVVVRASHSPEGDRVELRVSDTGQGLTQAQIAALFEPFNRLGAERTPVEGSGMGLFVSKRFVDLMGATLSVDSEVEVGTTFVVSLPAAPS